MGGQQLLVIVDPAFPPEDAQRQVDTVLAHWPAYERPAWQALSPTALAEDQASLANAGVVWLVMQQAGTSACYELIGQLQDAHTPAVLSCQKLAARRPDLSAGALYQEGVVLSPPGTDSQTTCAMLRSLWSQVPSMLELQGELALMQQQHGGLTGQIQRMDEELRLAAQLQRDFLPTTLPRMHDLDCRVLWRPANYVSGDIYDVLRLDENHLGIFIADAVGHGVPAALMTMYIKRSLHTKTIDPSLPDGYRLVEPAETLARLNHDLIERQGDQVRFATACYAIVDCRNYEVRLARAGHPYPILLRTDGHSQSLESEGSLLGVFEQEQFEQITAQLEPGDRMLLYSDGFEVAFPDAEVNGTSRIASMQYCQEFEDLRHGPLGQALHRLEEKLDAQVGSLNQRDDLTVVCLAVAGAEAEAEATSEKQQSRKTEKQVVVVGGRE